MWAYLARHNFILVMMIGMFVFYRSEPMALILGLVIGILFSIYLKLDEILDEAQQRKFVLKLTINGEKKQLTNVVNNERG